MYLDLLKRHAKSCHHVDEPADVFRHVDYLHPLSKALFLHLQLGHGLGQIGKLGFFESLQVAFLRVYVLDGKRGGPYKVTKHILLL